MVAGGRHGAVNDYCEDIDDGRGVGLFDPVPRRPAGGLLTGSLARNCEVSLAGLVEFGPLVSDAATRSNRRDGACRASPFR